jgi:hypothetical protein
VLPVAAVRLTLPEIEAIIGGALPLQAHAPSFWTNRSPRLFTAQPSVQAGWRIVCTGLYAGPPAVRVTRVEARAAEYARSCRPGSYSQAMRMIWACVAVAGSSTVTRGVRGLVSDQTTVSWAVGKSRSAPQYLQTPCTVGRWGSAVSNDGYSPPAPSLAGMRGGAMRLV